MQFELHALGRVGAAFAAAAETNDETTASGTWSRPGAAPLPLVEGLDRPDGLVDFRAGLALQEQLRAESVAGDRGATLLLLEHTPVYTAGRSASESEYPYDGTEVVPIDRGGKVTWHGPGQLVAYVIGPLAGPFDVSGLVRELEDSMISAIVGYGIAASATPGRPGVWCEADARGPARKIAAIGLSVRRGITMHGVALNCSNDLRPFATIVPCGISDAGVTNITDERVGGSDPVTPAAVAVALAGEIE
ncbi:MAG: lipoyl(octanoyl) transferase LipB, partial [Pseudoclavibacter sp.]